MFHATISDADRETLQVSGTVEPYDLQMLREHVLARRGRGTRVQVRLAPELRRAFLRALGDISKRGVTLVIDG
jgi:hypothetical protein